MLFLRKKISKIQEILLPLWWHHDTLKHLPHDLLAGLVVGAMLIPQSLAYAMLAGLPPQYGLYASLLPVVIYAWLGSSTVLAVGPVAIVSAMTASALAPLAVTGSAEYIALAGVLALLSGLALLIVAALRLGVLSSLLGQPVIHGFMIGAGLLIVLGQVLALLGIPERIHAAGALEQLAALWRGLPQMHGLTACIGVSALGLVFLGRHVLTGWQARLVPVLVLVVFTLISMLMDAQAQGVRVVGLIPSIQPPKGLSLPSMVQISALALPALLIAMVGMVESISVARALARQRREVIHVNREFLAMGMVNIASSWAGAFPVSGGFSRSAVNMQAGARTQVAGLVTALIMLLVTIFATSWFAHIPQAVLSAMIIAAVLPLINLSDLPYLWRYDPSDAVVLICTALGVLLLGAEQGIVLGLVLSLAAMVIKTSRPHIAVLGRIPGTEHFRNVKRHAVQTHPHILCLRIDENLYFGNVHMVEQRILQEVQTSPRICVLLLAMQAVNRVDSSGLDMLLNIQEQMKSRGLRLALAEVKGPLMDVLGQTALIQGLQDPVYLSVHQAFDALGGTTQNA